MVRLGIETLTEGKADLLADERLGLITNPSGVTSDLTPTIDVLNGMDCLDLTVLFAPEHGIRGNIQADVTVEENIDERTGLPVKSLYGERKARIDENLSNVDVLVYDIQDVGCRFYTLVYTLAYALEGVAHADKRLVVLDRPNPIAPVEPVGNIADSYGHVDLGGYGFPIVYGLTAGELARYLNKRFDIGADLDIIEMDGWDHSTWYDETSLPWVQPSPNMPTITTATLYPGTCLFEGTSISEGRGTTKPFELIGAPWIDADDWADTLNAQGLDGVGFRPAYFTPTFSKHERQDIEGVQIHVLNRDEISPVRVGLTMLVSAFQTYPDTSWLEFNGGYFIDQLAGGAYVRKTVEDVDPSVAPIDVANGLIDSWSVDLTDYRGQYESYTLY
ncbi:exo-beta-N-acetylmuramidase NamZ domain-containing protein [Halopelagius fulvigenes]|uniref:Exo-beta-N-acetylmuramidase NamZ domain-containing protein n=1 Tax=Halopelagius fulvigenes TaxID=1198324 RepID=A0ABD5U396_9EURY